MSSSIQPVTASSLALIAHHPQNPLMELWLRSKEPVPAILSGIHYQKGKYIDESYRNGP